MKLSKSVNKYWFSYFFVKLFYMFFALFVFTKFTNPDRMVGDVELYLRGDMSDSWHLIFTDSTIMLEFFGKYCSIFLGPIFANLPFVLISFYGIFYSISKIQLTNNQLVWALFLLSLPSFGVYSSVIGKEAVSVFYMGIICGYLIDVLNKTRIKPKLIDLLAFYLLFLFTPYFFLAISNVFIFILISNKFHLKGYGKMILLILNILFIIFLLYILRDVINNLSFDVVKHFSPDARSTRENIFFVNNYDVFWNAPYGMFIAFWGPTFEEISQKPIQSIAFIESVIIFCFFLFFISKFLVKILKTSRLNIYAFSLKFIALFWILFANYPSGVLNPGSALRYRERFYGFLIVFLFYLYLKYIKKNQRLEI